MPWRTICTLGILGILLLKNETHSSKMLGIVQKLSTDYHFKWKNRLHESKGALNWHFLIWVETLNEKHTVCMSRKVLVPPVTQVAQTNKSCKALSINTNTDTLKSLGVRSVSKHICLTMMVKQNCMRKFCPWHDALQRQSDSIHQIWPSLQHKHTNCRRRLMTQPPLI